MMKAFALLLLLLAFLVDEALSELVSTEKALQFNAAQRVFGRDRIINGNRARKGQFPYQVALLLQTEEGIHLCGGSIIDTRWILTAAHCVDPNLVLAVVMVGTNDFQLNKEKGRQQFHSTEAHIHPKYNFPYYDVALLKLPTEIIYNSYAQKIALAPATFIATEGAQATLSGWGYVNDDIPSISPHDLKYTTRLEVVSNSICEAAFPDVTGTGTESIICARGRNTGPQSACQGDSGGPLVVQDANGRPMQLAIVSFVSTSGCTLHRPFGLASVPATIDWIETTTGLKF